MTIAIMTDVLYMGWKLQTSILFALKQKEVLLLTDDLKKDQIIDAGEKELSKSFSQYFKAFYNRRIRIIFSFHFK